MVIDYDVLEIIVVFIGLFAFLGIIMVLILTHKYGTIFTPKNSKFFRIISFFTGGLLLIVSYFINSIEMTIVAIALFAYVFGSPKLLSKLQSSENPIPSTSTPTHFQSVISPDKGAKIKIYLKTLLEWGIIISIAAAIIVASFYLAAYKPNVDKFLTVLVIGGLILGPIIGGLLVIKSLIEITKKIS